MVIWITALIFLALLFAFLGWRIGPQGALGVVVATTWLVPGWLILPLTDGPSGSIVGAGPDLRMGVSAACLILYCFIPGRTFPVRLVPSDFTLIGLVVVHLVSDLLNDGYSAKLLGQVYVEWYLPYVCGRIAVHGRKEVDLLWRVIAAVAIILACCSVVEALADVHLLERLVGERPEEGSNRDGMRWGIQRAYGPSLHPIYFGVTQLLMLGWIVHGSLRALKRKANAIWVFAPLPAVVGIICTASRGPILGIVAAAFGGLFYFTPKLRIPLSIAFAGLIATSFVFHEPIIQQLEQWSGEKQREIKIQGEERTFSSVRSRLNILEVNKIALKRSGLIGFGSEAVAGFPVNVPLGEMEVKTLKTVKYIDNTYILLVLRFGYLGAGLFALTGLSCLYQLFVVSTKYVGESPGQISGCLGAVLLAVLLVQATVWLPPDIGFPLLWTMGASSGLLLADQEGRLGNSVALLKASE